MAFDSGWYRCPPLGPRPSQAPHLHMHTPALTSHVARCVRHGPLSDHAGGSCGNTSALMQLPMSGDKHRWQGNDSQSKPLTGTRRCRLWLYRACKDPCDRVAQLAHTLQSRAHQGCASETGEHQADVQSKAPLCLCHSLIQGVCMCASSETHSKCRLLRSRHTWAGDADGSVFGAVVGHIPAVGDARALQARGPRLVRPIPRPAAGATAIAGDAPACGGTRDTQGAGTYRGAVHETLQLLVGIGLPLHSLSFRRMAIRSCAPVAM